MAAFQIKKLILTIGAGVLRFIECVTRDEDI